VHRHATGMTRRLIMGCMNVIYRKLHMHRKGGLRSLKQKLLPQYTYALLTRESTYYKPASDCVYAATAVDVEF